MKLFGWLKSLDAMLGDDDGLWEPVPRPPRPTALELSLRLDQRLTPEEYEVLRAYWKTRAERVA